MRGQVFVADAVIATILVLVGLIIFLNGMYGVVGSISEDLLYRRIELTVDHAVTKLLLSDGIWRCKVNDVPVPGCIMEGTYVSSPDLFFLNDVDCNLEGSVSIATLLGCTKPVPTDANWVVVREFNACLATLIPSKCTPKTLRLTVWG